MTDELPVLMPDLQVSFFYKLKKVSDLQLAPALAREIERIDLNQINHELSQYVPAAALSRLAQHGLRGETFFPLPCVLKGNPFLLAYYRLLLGFSQKEFYKSRNFGKFKKLEDQGTVGSLEDRDLQNLSHVLCHSSASLLMRIDEVSMSSIRDMQIMMLGAQFRGGENNRIGQEAILDVYDLIATLASDYIIDRTDRTIVLENDSKRKVIVEFASDPDVRVVQSLGSGVRPILSIEIKGGGDVSNIHNRLGEAEKSHQKARQLGCFEFWTIVKADVDENLAKYESPTTSRFFSLERIRTPGDDQYPT